MLTRPTDNSLIVLEKSLIIALEYGDEKISTRNDVDPKDARTQGLK